MRAEVDFVAVQVRKRLLVGHAGAVDGVRSGEGAWVRGNRSHDDHTPLRRARLQAHRLEAVRTGRVEGCL